MCVLVCECAAYINLGKMSKSCVRDSSGRSIGVGSMHDLRAAQSRFCWVFFCCFFCFFVESPQYSIYICIYFWGFCRLCRLRQSHARPPKKNLMYKSLHFLYGYERLCKCCARARPMIVWRLNGILIGPPSSDCCATVTAVGHARAYDDEEACVEWWESVPHVGGGADPVEVGWGEGRFWVAIKLILIEVFHSLSIKST